MGEYVKDRDRNESKSGLASLQFFNLANCRFGKFPEKISSVDGICWKIQLPSASFCICPQFRQNYVENSANLFRKSRNFTEIYKIVCSSAIFAFGALQQCANPVGFEKYFKMKFNEH